MLTTLVSCAVVLIKCTLFVKSSRSPAAGPLAPPPWTGASGSAPLDGGLGLRPPEGVQLHDDGRRGADTLGAQLAWRAGPRRWRSARAAPSRPAAPAGGSILGGPGMVETYR